MEVVGALVHNGDRALYPLRPCGVKSQPLEVLPEYEENLTQCAWRAWWSKFMCHIGGLGDKGFARFGDEDFRAM